MLIKSSGNRLRNTKLFSFIMKQNLERILWIKYFGRETTNSRRSGWPLAVFFNIGDIAGLAACIIYTANNDMVSHKTNNRRLFLRKLNETFSIPGIQD